MRLKAGRAAARPLHLRRGRPRQDDADGPVLRRGRGRRASAARISTPSWPTCTRACIDGGRRASAAKSTGDDPIAPVAAELAREASLLCFDEFSVRDIADAMILGRLFTALFAAGVVVVATSNVAPDDLYKDGLNRALFLPFIALLQRAARRRRARRAHRLPAGKARSGRRSTTRPIGPKADAALDAAFLALTGQRARRAGGDRAARPPSRRAAGGRRRRAVRFRRALPAPARLGRLSSSSPQRFHTILIDRIPALADGERNEAKRFIILIDALYDMRVKLIASAAAEPEALFAGADGAEAFEFARTASRLFEMRSADYLALPHGRETGRAGRRSRRHRRDVNGVSRGDLYSNKARPLRLRQTRIALGRCGALDLDDALVVGWVRRASPCETERCARLRRGPGRPARRTARREPPRRSKASRLALAMNGRPGDAGFRRRSPRARRARGAAALQEREAHAIDRGEVGPALGDRLEARLDASR